MVFDFFGCLAILMDFSSFYDALLVSNNLQCYLIMQSLFLTLQKDLNLIKFYKELIFKTRENVFASIDAKKIINENSNKNNPLNLQLS